MTRMLLAPKSGVVYGPVRSRRLGASLGINLLPPGRKLCTFDCLYCQYGWTDRSLLRRAGPADFPTVDEVMLGVEAALARCAEPPAYLTFSGNGEPTLHPDLPEIVDGIIHLRDRVVPSARTAILSNGTRVGEPVIRDALTRLDARIMKLDAGTEEALRRYNRPVEPITLDEIAEGLRSLGRVTIQALFTAGPGGNAGAVEVDSWARRVAAISPVAVQIYTLARGWPSDVIEPVDRSELERIRATLVSRGIDASVF